MLPCSYHLHNLAAPVGTVCSVNTKSHSPRPWFPVHFSNLHCEELIMKHCEHRPGNIMESRKRKGGIRRKLAHLYSARAFHWKLLKFQLNTEPVLNLRMGGAPTGAAAILPPPPPTPSYIISEVGINNGEPNLFGGVKKNLPSWRYGLCSASFRMRYILY